MNCSEWEERIALYAGGDLAGSPAEQGLVEQHVAECPGCQVFASGLKESLAVLREAHEELVGPAHFAAVRARVLAELERQRLPVWRRGWIWEVAAAALVMAVAAGVRWGSPPLLPLPVVALTQPAAPVVERVVAPVRVARPPVRSARAKTEPLMIRIVTDDPDVVIYWIAETKGEY